jgi:hypothetical protein
MSSGFIYPERISVNQSLKNSKNHDKKPFFVKSPKNQKKPQLFFICVFNKYLNFFNSFLSKKSLDKKVLTNS